MNDTAPPASAPAAGPADENQIIAERRAKLAALRADGPAFPNDFVREHVAGDLTARYGDLDREALAQANVEVVLAGRMMLKRVMGKASFATVQDSTGRLRRRQLSAGFHGDEVRLLGEAGWIGRAQLALHVGVDHAGRE